MKPNESVEKYASEARLYTNYAIKHIKTICKSFGARPVGSDSEKNAREYLAKELETTCDSVKQEEFKCSDKAFMSWVQIGAALMLAAILFFTFGIYAASLAITVLTVLLIVLEFVFYIPVIDLFFPKKTSANVIGVRKASGDVKRRIILSGHTDSAYEWTFTYKGGRPAVALIIFGAAASILLCLGGSIYSLTVGDGAVWTNDSLVPKIIAVLLYVTVPIIIAAFWFVNYKKPVTGANDNLSGCMLSSAVLKFMQANNIRFENTEVVALMTGGEEAGLRGSKAWAKAHAQEIKAEKDVETVFISLDTIREFDHMTIYAKDMNGTTRNSQKAVDLLKNSAEAAGYYVKIKDIELGATDAAALSKAGIPAAAFVAMDSAPARYYHTRLDTEDNIDPKSLEAGLKIALEAVFMFDEKGL